MGYRITHRQPVSKLCGVDLWPGMVGLGCIVVSVLAFDPQPKMILDIVLAFSAWLWAVVLHEAGHYFYFRWVLHKKVVISLGDVPGSGTRLRVGCPADYRGHSATQRRYIYLAGIAAGTIPLILLTVYRWPYAGMIILYLVLGCRTDLNNVFRQVI